MENKLDEYMEVFNEIQIYVKRIQRLLDNVNSEELTPDQVSLLRYGHGLDFNNYSTEQYNENWRYEDDKE